MQPVDIQPMDGFLSHLEFLGYTLNTIDAEKHITGAKHPTRHNLVVRPWRYGALLSASYGATPAAKADKTGEMALLKVANEFNMGFTLCRAVLDKDKDFIMEAYYPVAYNKRDFGVFLDTIENDINNGFKGISAESRALIA